jgi:RNA recognition motif-containing protein
MSLRSQPTMTDSEYQQRDRSRSPRRRSRSPRHRNRSYSPRSRSRSRDGYRRSDRRSRSPVRGADNSSARQPSRSHESKEQVMANVRENSQQDRRVYVGNLSYDVKWHHLKDFMRQGEKSQLFRDASHGG